MKHSNIENLETMFSDMKIQADHYKPTEFWANVSIKIRDTIRESGLSNFRFIELTRQFFAPTYSFTNYHKEQNLYAKTKQELNKIIDDSRLAARFNNLLSGKILANADYRTIQAADKPTPPYIDQVSESKIGNPIEQFELDGRYFSRSFLNYMLGITFLKKHVDTQNIENVMEIGGGYGTLGELLLGDERNNYFYINADIPPTSFVSSYYLKEVFGEKHIADYFDIKDSYILDINLLKTKYKALNIASWQIEKLQGSIDLFVNFISFQEMEPEIVQNYAKHIIRLNPQYILLRNMEEGKEQKNSTNMYGVNNPIKGKDYDDFFPNYELVATNSNIYGFITEDGFHSQLRLYKKTT